MTIMISVLITSLSINLLLVANILLLKQDIKQQKQDIKQQKQLLEGTLFEISRLSKIISEIVQIHQN